jgi:hypothetical protein
VQSRVAKLAFNRGLVSRLGLARADIKRLRWRPRSRRTGLARARLDVAALRLGLPRQLEERRGGAPHPVRLLDHPTRRSSSSPTRRCGSGSRDALLTRNAVGTAVTNGTFNVDIAGWTDGDEAGGTIVYAAATMQLSATARRAAIGDQQVTVLAADQQRRARPADRGRARAVTLRVGSAVGSDELCHRDGRSHGDALDRRSRRRGISGSSSQRAASARSSRIVTIEAAGVMEHHRAVGAADLGKIRYDQSADVVFVACEGYRSAGSSDARTRSWSVRAVPAE